MSEDNLVLDPNKSAGEQVFEHVAANYEEQRIREAKQYTRYVTDLETRAKNNVKRNARAMEAIGEFRRALKAEIDDGGNGSEAYAAHYDKCCNLTHR